ncbi:MAG: T9SS-dependent M36 family metallopeptidase [Oceanihabitans sp.]
MKNYYLKALSAFVLLFAVQIGFAQNTLQESPNGQIIKSYLNSEMATYGLSGADIQSLYVTNEYFSKYSKTTHVYVNQAYQGVKIHNAISSVAVKNNKVSYYANSFISDISSKINSLTPSINAKNAIEKAATYFNLGNTTNLNLVRSNGNDYVYTNGGISKVEIPVSLVYTQTQEGNLILSWDLSIHTTNGKDWWSVRVDALTGEVLENNNWILTCNFGDVDHKNHKHNTKVVAKEDNFSLFKTNSSTTDGSQYNVFVIPVESPNDGGRTLISQPADATASPYGWHDDNGSTGPEYTITRGNNVWAQEDVNGNDGTGASPNSATLNFDYPLDLFQAPIGYQNASLTNLFYMNNIMHDVWYQYGFDEASGNFQQNNYGNGGLGGDFVYADGQDGSGTNNATFGTPPDGSNPGMTMYLWNEPAQKELVTLNNGSLAGGFVAVNPASTAPNNLPGATTSPVTADLAIIIDDNANTNNSPMSTDPNDACDDFTAATNLTNKIAVIRRGACSFVDKIQRAQDAGAVGVIMFNHNNPTNDPAYTEYVNMAGQTTTINIPAVFINNTDGEAIFNAIANGETINATLLDYQTYQLDGSLDNLIVGHEYGHGISTRLTGGASNSGCLSNAEQMGEGWSDWFALMLTMKPGDLATDGRGIATYSAGQQVDAVGIRPAHYSTDLALNDYTYGDTNNTAVSQPHGIGFIWATVLWDLTWAYVDKYGFDADVYNGTGGNNKVMQLVIDGIKNQPCGVGFVQGRDALLAADTNNNGGVDQCLIWEVFAARGIGVNASQGLGFSRTDQVEDFNMPPDNDPSLDNCTTLSIDDLDENDYRVYPNPTNNTLNIKTNKNFGAVTLTLTDINGRQVLSKKADLFNTIELNISKLQSGLYILNINGQSINANTKIIKN